MGARKGNGGVPAPSLDASSVPFWFTSLSSLPLSISNHCQKHPFWLPIERLIPWGTGSATSWCAGPVSHVRPVAAGGSWQLQAVEALGPGGCVGVGEEVARHGGTKEIPVHKVGRVLHIESARGGIGKGECHVRATETGHVGHGESRAGRPVIGENLIQLGLVHRPVAVEPGQHGGEHVLVRRPVVIAPQHLIQFRVQFVHVHHAVVVKIAGEQFKSSDVHVCAVAAEVGLASRIFSEVTCEKLVTVMLK